MQTNSIVPSPVAVLITSTSVNNILASVQNKINNLNCDNATRVISYLLTINNIQHKVMLGCASMGDISLPVYFWIEIGTMKIDMKAKMWFGNEAIEGFFKDSKVQYFGHQVPLKVTNT